MRLIQTVHQGDRQHPLQEAMKFVLINCCCFVDVGQYPKHAIIGNGFITDTEYRVDIAVDEYEVHSYFRCLSRPQRPVLEIIFFRETIPNIQ